MADEAKRFTIDVPKGMIAELDKIAEQDDRTRAAVIRRALTRYIEHKENTTNA